jgi:hypothetical protein
VGKSVTVQSCGIEYFARTGALKGKKYFYGVKIEAFGFPKLKKDSKTGLILH